MKKLKNKNIVRHGGQVLYLPNSRSRSHRQGEIQYKEAETFPEMLKCT